MPPFLGVCQYRAEHEQVPSSFQLNSGELSVTQSVYCDTGNVRYSVWGQTATDGANCTTLNMSILLDAGQRSSSLVRLNYSSFDPNSPNLPMLVAYMEDGILFRCVGEWMIATLLSTFFSK